ncbi:MAG: M56 family metallopeptidase [Armatimonas sp.]
MTETLLTITVVCVVALLLVRTGLRYHPSARYFVCLAALILMLLTPALVTLRHFTSFGLITLTVPQSTGASESTLVVASPTPKNDWLLWSIGTLWVFGVLVGVLRFATGWRQAARLKRGAVPITIPAGVQASVERILKRPLPPVYTSPRVTSPVAVGLFTPVIILPIGMVETLSPIALRHVLLHESAHIALGHTLGGVVERLAGILSGRICWFAS